MAIQTAKHFIKDFAFYICAIFLGIVAWYAQSRITTLPPGTVLGPPIVNLDKTDQELRIFLEVNQLLITLGTSVLGALGIILFRGGAVNERTSRLWAAMLGALLVGVSIFSGYQAYVVVMSMLLTGVNTFEGAVTPPFRTLEMHFYTFLAGIVFLADFVLHNVKKEGEREKAPLAAGS